jgi:hypothetical protein
MEFEIKKVDTRFIIVEKETGNLLDDAQGYGYKTARGAHKAGWYKYQRGKEKITSEKSDAKKFWKQHSDIKQEVIQMLENSVKEICRGEITETEIISDLEKHYGFVFPQAAIKYLGW